MKIVVLGLSITSSWGNGHATTYRGVLRELAARGHEVQFLERNQPWYADNRDLVELTGVAIKLYASLDELNRYHLDDIREADAVIVGSYVPDGIAVGDWVLENATGLTAFYDIDTPITLASLRGGGCAYLHPGQIPRYQLYLSFTGGPMLRELEDTWGSPMARPLYCAVDPRAYYPENQARRWDFGYLGTYSRDRQPALEHLMLASARRLPAHRFVVAGPQYPENIDWPGNVERIVHLPPSRHRQFYNQQRFTLNLTRADMVAAGWSPSVRLFEAAACGAPIVSDYWPGLEDFFAIGREILLATSAEDIARLLQDLSENDAAAIGLAARRRVLERHTAAHRARELEAFLFEAARAAQCNLIGYTVAGEPRGRTGVYAAAAKRARSNFSHTLAP
jgi:spore maturation protein CgeB